jgi:hypothetical protein
MNFMKKWIAIALSMTLIITSLAPASNNVSATDKSTGGLGNIPIDLSKKTETQPFDYEFIPVSANWKKMRGNVAPALFSGVHYELAEGVVEINSNISDQVSSAAQLITGSGKERRKNNQIVKEGGYIPKAILEKATFGNKVAPGTVFVDVGTATAFKVVSPVEYSETTQYFKDTYSVKQPQITEIVSDFTLPEQTVEMTLGNIDGFAENVEEHVVMKEGMQYTLNSGYKDFKYLKDPLISLQFPEDTKLVGYSGNGSSLTVTVNGGLGIGDMNLTGKYSAFGGYRIGLNMKQKCYLSVELATKIDEEIRIPLLGISVPFGIGSIAGGVFLVVDMNGELKLEVQVREFTENTIGIKGKTAFYVPCTYRPIFENNDSKFEGDVDIAGQLNGEVKAGALLEIEIFGLRLVGAGAFVGAGLNVSKHDKDLHIELYALLQAYLCFMGKNFNLVNYHLTLLEKKQRDTGGYRIEIKEALLSPQRVGGIINAQEGDNYIPAEGIEYRIKIIPKDIDLDSDSDLIRYYPAPINGEAEYDVTNEEGEFFRDDVSIEHKDRVCIEFKALGNTYESETVLPTLPFKNIRVSLADYFNEYVTGQVEPVRLIRWAATKDSPPEDRTELTYYQGFVTISMDTGGNQAIAKTDKNGYFNTEDLLVFGDNLTIPNTINIYPDSAIFASIDAGGLTMTSKSMTEPSVNFEVLRVINGVEKSYPRYQEGEKIVDQVAYNEYIWIINKNGTKTLANSQFSYEAYGYSTQDKWTKG